MEKINSPIFGPINLLDENDEKYPLLESQVKDFPVTVFGLLNREINKRGLCIKIDVMPKKETN